MRGRLVFGILLILAVVLVIGIIGSSLFSNNGSYHGRNAIKGVPPFESIGGKVISYEEFVRFIVSRNLAIYLPTWLPKKYSLATIWAKNTSHGLEFPLIIVYSKGGSITDYRAREDNLVVEITKVSPAPLKQYIEDGATPIYNAQGKLIGALFTEAYCPTCISQKTIPLAIVRIDGLEYLISFRDANTLLKIVHSMKRLTIK
ncbi:MAG: hypothetical protein B6U85_04280 [Desulfurococcales archaeon ex4484_42]|nr:MAG: hypothetical protein B6U85_04280 [Desulfurococcales archaeon ex4484_42]